jgi:hypothetical protein
MRQRGRALQRGVISVQFFGDYLIADNHQKIVGAPDFQKIE